MKKLLTLVLVIGIIFMLSLSVSAADIIEVDSYWNGCYNFDSCVPALKDGIDSFVLIESFAAGQYLFEADSGAFSTRTRPDGGESWLARKWFWSLNIYDPAADVLYTDLRSYTPYDDEALVEMPNGSITIDLASAGDLWFYVEHVNPRDDIGTVSVAYSIVPEPISSALFVIGGVVLGGRSYIKRKKAKVRI